MAFLARHQSVFAGERKPRQLMVKQNFFLPAIDVMTAPTIGPEPRFMRIIVDMASDAFAWRQFHMGWFLVTCLAQYWLMRAFKREAGHRIVVELSDFPVFAVVALGAIGAVPAFMLIFFLVAADACHRGLLDGIIRTMASGTGRSGMRPDQLEFSILIVVEIDRSPG